MDRLENKKKQETYQRLRLQTLRLKPEQIQAKLQRASQIYAALIDFKVPGGTVSLACLLDGTVNFYYSLGGGLLGMGQKYEEVRSAGKKLLLGAEQVLGHLKPAMSLELAAEADCSVFLLAKHCIYWVEFDTDDMTAQPEYIRVLNSHIQDVLKTLRRHSN